MEAGTGQIVVDQQAALDCLYAIEAISKLIQKANENTAEAVEGVYGAAVVIEQNANKLLAMVGEEG